MNKMSLARFLGGIELEEDCKRYKQIMHVNLVKCFFTCTEFRYQFYYRMRIHSKVWSFLLKPLVPFNFYHLYLGCKHIGGGLFIQHGHNTSVDCKSMGKNCWINHNVTVGFSKPECTPIIGDNVHICTGAVVLGDIRIGNDVIIGANAVVVKDVPDHSIVAGVPAKVIKSRPDMQSEWVRVKEDEL